MTSSIIVLFGEAEKGDLEKPYYCQNLEQLFELLGQPPSQTQGLHFAVQSLMYGHPCLYFRVQEEGVSVPDYHFGLGFLHKASPNPQFPHIGALGFPGMGLQEVIEEGLIICKEHRSLLLMSEQDFYDWLTDKPVT